MAEVNTPRPTKIGQTKVCTELRSRTLASIKPEVSQALNSLLDEIRASDDAKVMRTATGGFRRSTPVKSPPRKGLLVVLIKRNQQNLAIFVDVFLIKQLFHSRLLDMR